jgi:glutamate--cysteine ligase
VTIARALFTRLRDELHARCFTPADGSQSIGGEVELLALDADTLRPVPLVGKPRALIPAIRNHAARRGWREHESGGLIKFDLPNRGIISFEPGGQLELSSVPCRSPGALVALLDDVVRPLCAELLDQGIALQSVGIDPTNDARDVPLQLHVDRYARMTTYFDRIGPFGVRMMRQTAAMQLSVDRGADPAQRWQLLNDLAPYLIAIFANSPRYGGVDTGHRSYRAHCWRQLDVTRTGVIAAGNDAADDYTRFALAAHDMMRADSADTHQPFAWWSEREHDDARWQTHLTTLFPEVRARGHFELRSCDAVPVEWYAVPIVVLYGITYDGHAAAEAALLAADSRVLLRASGEIGLGDPALARTARDLFQLGLQGARRLGVSAAPIETCEEFYRRFTACDASPGDEANVARMRTVRSRSSRV